MTKYLLVYHGGADEESDSVDADVMAQWGAWFGQLGAAVVDGGNPVAGARTVGNGTVSDGGGANPATGYSLIEAADFDDAVAKAKGCPVLASGGTVEVCETVEIDM